MCSLNNICISCMSKTYEFCNLNEIIVENLKVLEVLNKIIHFLLENQEFPLPEIMCKLCLDKLIISYNFQKQCQDSLQNLYKLWTDNKLEQTMEENIMQANDNEIDILEYDEKQYSLEEMEQLNNCDGEIEEDLWETEELENIDENSTEHEKVYKCQSKTQLKPNFMNHGKINDEINVDSIATDNMVKCVLCNELFKHNNGLAMHMGKKHRGVSIYQCDKCDKGFALEEQFKHHYNRHMGIKIFKCSQCSKAFDNIRCLNQHLITHSEINPYLCTICGKAFRRSGGLKQHMLRHTDEKPYECLKCPKSFKCASNHYLHMLTHNKVKPYLCKICGSRFTRSDTLLHHQIIHTGEKPYTCDQCERGFNSRTNMRRHQRTHTGEKPFRCQYCDKGFGQSNDMKKHILRTHDTKHT